MAELHHDVAEMMRNFRYDHLPDNLQEVSEPFAILASMVTTLGPDPEHRPSIELLMCLRKLLEAKDCAVRAALS